MSYGVLGDVQGGCTRCLSWEQDIASRRLYRPCHRRVVSEFLQLAALNGQGINSSRVDNHMAAALVAEAHRGKRHAAFVSGGGHIHVPGGIRLCLSGQGFVSPAPLKT